MFGVSNRTADLWCLQLLRDERDRLQAACERVLDAGRSGSVDREACARFGRAAARINELHDQIYVLERELGAALSSTLPVTVNADG